MKYKCIFNKITHTSFSQGQSSPWHSLQFAEKWAVYAPPIEGLWDGTETHPGLQSTDSSQTHRFFQVYWHGWMEPRGNSHALHKDSPPAATGKMLEMTDSVHGLPEPCNDYSRVRHRPVKEKIGNRGIKIMHLCVMWRGLASGCSALNVFFVEEPHNGVVGQLLHYQECLLEPQEHWEEMILSTHTHGCYLPTTHSTYDPGGSPHPCIHQFH